MGEGEAGEVHTAQGSHSVECSLHTEMEEGAHIQETREGRTGAAPLHPRASGSGVCRSYSPKGAQCVRKGPT